MNNLNYNDFKEQDIIVFSDDNMNLLVDGHINLFKSELNTEELTPMQIIELAASYALNDIKKVDEINKLISVDSQVGEFFWNITSEKDAVIINEYKYNNELESVELYASCKISSNDESEASEIAFTYSDKFEEYLSYTGFERITHAASAVLKTCVSISALQALDM